MATSKKPGPARRGGGGRPSHDASARLTNRIVDVATGLFLGAGFEATSIETIVARAGISKRTFYARFGGKSDLFAAVVIRLGAQHSARLDALPPNTGSLQERLEATAAEILKITCEPDAIALNRIVTAEVARFPELGQILYDFAGPRVSGAICKVLDQACAAGEIAPLDTGHAAQVFLQAAVIGPMRRVMFGLEDSRLSAERLDRLQRTVRLFLDGVRGSVRRDRSVR